VFSTARATPWEETTKQREFEFLDGMIHPIRTQTRNFQRIACYALLGMVMAVFPLRASAESRFIPRILVSSTIPATGDLNPYGVAFVPAGFPAGSLNPGDVLVSNFNNSKNLQGLGSTIIKLTPSRGAAADMTAQVFFQETAPLGLTTALGVLTRGFVLAGNVTTTDGTSATVTGGPLLFIDHSGKLLGQLDSSPSTKLNGPWDLALEDGFDHAKVFVSNVLDGTVVRIHLALPDSETVTVKSITQIASGYKHRTDPTALVIGPTGLFYDGAADILYVASTGDNAIFMIPHAGSAGATSGTGKLIFKDSHLRGPLALALAPNGDLLTSNGDAVNPDPAQPSEIVEFTKAGTFVGEYNVHQNEGGAFGIATFTKGTADLGIVNLLAAVNDNANDVAITKFVML
jgi:hypothetical protein